MTNDAFVDRLTELFLYTKKGKHKLCCDCNQPSGRWKRCDECANQKLVTYRIHHKNALKT